MKSIIAVVGSSALVLAITGCYAASGTYVTGSGYHDHLGLSVQLGAPLYYGSHWWKPYGYWPHRYYGDYYHSHRRGFHHGHKVYRHPVKPFPHPSFKHHYRYDGKTPYHFKKYDHRYKYDGRWQKSGKHGWPDRGYRYDRYRGFGGRGHR